MAMLEDAPVVAVDHAERELLRITGCPEAETPRLERCHLFAQIRDLDAAVNGELRVGFAKLAYGRAVLTHFWDGYPSLRQQLAQWVQGLAGLPQLTNEDRRCLADRFTDQSLRAGHIGDLLRTAGIWARHRKQSVRLLAYRMLATAVIDDRFGWFVRRRLYDWAGNRQLNSQQARIIIAICAGVLGRSYPDRALWGCTCWEGIPTPGLPRKLAKPYWNWPPLMTDSFVGCWPSSPTLWSSTLSCSWNWLIRSG